MLGNIEDPSWNVEDHLIGFGADGASVNFGVNNGVFTKLAEDMPWMMGIHCVAHRLELAAKDGFKNTYFTKEVCFSSF